MLQISTSYPTYCLDMYIYHFRVVEFIVLLLLLLLFLLLLFVVVVVFFCFFLFLFFSFVVGFNIFYNNPCIYCKLYIANSVDPDQTTRSAASDLGLHCLHLSFYGS